MVFMHFPAYLTEEEELLQKKYAKLKKKKLALKAMRAPKPEPVQPAEEAKKRAYEQAAEATEEAKKLIKSGTIKVNERKGQREFKRTKRSKDNEKLAVVFQPFQASQNSDQEEDKVDSASSGKKDMKNLYESFVSSREPRLQEESPRNAQDSQSHSRGAGSGGGGIERRRERRDSDREPPKKGNTIYVHGIGITEELLKKTFSHSGKLVNLSLERDKNCGFVTFERMEEAEEAIAQMNGSIVQDIQLKVSMARRQPTFEHAVDPSSASWAATAASKSQKGSHKDKRDLVVYDDSDIF